MKDRGDRESTSGSSRPAPGSPAARTGHPVNPKAAALLRLQRTAGNLAVSRYMPVPPGTPGPIAHALNKTPLEQVQDLLEYSVIDWAVTHDDARRATVILGDMDDGELTRAVGHLDGSSTPYLDRLVDKADLPTVRLPAFAKIARKRSPARNKALAEKLLSYGVTDWEITPPEAEAAQTLIDALPEGDRDKIGEEWMRKRIEANIAKEGDYEKGVGEQLLDGALQGDFNEDPTFWNVVGQVALGFVPYAGQAADVRDLIIALDDMFNKGGYKKFGSWVNLLLVVVGFVPGFGDAAKAVGRGAFHAVKSTAVKVGRGLWDLAARKLVEPLIKHLLPEAIGKAKKALKEFLDDLGKRFAREHPNGPPAPHGEKPGGTSGGGPDAPGAAVPSVEQLGKQTDDAFAEAAKQAPRRVGEVVSEMVHEAVDELKRWAEKVYKQFNFERFEVEIHGDELVLYGIGSKYPLIKAKISDIKKETVAKSEEILKRLRRREDLLREARKAGGELGARLRHQAVDISEEIGERVADAKFLEKFPGAEPLYKGTARNDLDRVFKVGDELHIIEAKGGAGRLGSREIAPDQRAQQGSAAYLANLLQAMVASKNEEKVKIAKELLEKLKSSPDKVRMWAISTSKLNTSTSEELTVKIMKMDIP